MAKLANMYYLSRGEQTAQALEKNLSSLERKLDELLAGLEGGISGTDTGDLKVEGAGDGEEISKVKDEAKESKDHEGVTDTRESKVEGAGDGEGISKVKNETKESKNHEEGEN